MAVGPDLPIGSELLGYRIEQVLGRGGMGVVYLAEDRRLKRKVALKLLAPRLADDERFRERLLAESELAASLDHPNIVPIYEAGEADGRIFISMRYVEGQDLRRRLRDGPLERTTALAIVSQVASALDAAHARGLVHRDVKPSNVLIAPAAGHEGADHVYLADFGLSRRLAEQSRGAEGRSLGTVDYVAPEQIRGGEVDARADLYSLGCLLCECLTGRPPFDRASDTQVLFAHLEDAPPSVPGIEDVLRKALAKSPDDRYQAGRELVDAARAALGLGTARRSRWPLALAAAGVLVAGAALLAFFLTRGSGGSAVVDPTADSLIRIDPATNKVARTFPVGHKANGVAAAGRYVWETNAADKTVWRIDAKTGRALKLSTNGTPTGVATDGNTAVVADATEHAISSYDAATGRVRFSNPLTGGTDWQLPIAAGPGGIWFADGAGGIAGKVDDALSSGEPSVRASIPQPQTDFYAQYQTFDDVAVGAGAVWLAGDPFGREVWRIDPSSGRVTATIRPGFIPEAIAAGEGAVWVTSLFGDKVSRIDPATNRIVATIPVGRSPDSIAAGGGAIWVTSSIDDTLTRIDPATNRVIATIRLSETPRAVAAGPDGIWIAADRSPPVLSASNAIKIGIYADCSGAFGQSYDTSLAAAELPLIQRGARRTGPDVTDGITGLSIGGRPVKLYFGCDDIGGSQFHGVLREMRRLVEKVGVDIVIGPTDGDSMIALQAYARRHPETTFVNGSGAEPLIKPAPNFFNFYTQGAQWNAGLGAYAYHHLGWRHAVVITDLIAARFMEAQSSAFVAEFCSLGGTISKRVWIPFNATDLSATIAAIPRRGVDGIFISTAGPYLEPLIEGYAPYRGINVSRKLVLSSVSIYKVPPLKKIWRRATGLVYSAPGGGPGLAPGSKYLTDFKKAFPEIPSSLYGGGAFDLGYYDNAAAVVAALERVQGDLSRGQRRFRTVLSHVSVDGPSGPVTVDAHRQAVAPMYVYRLKGPKLAPHLIRTIPRVEPTFGGYFKASDPPPSKTTPACVKRTPPPWARSGS